MTQQNYTNNFYSKHYLYTNSKNVPRISLS